MPRSRYQPSVISGTSDGPTGPPRFSSVAPGVTLNVTLGPRSLHMWLCRSMTVANGDLNEPAEPNPKPLELKRPNSDARHDAFTFVSREIQDGSTSSTYTVLKCCYCCLDGEAQDQLTA